MSQLLSGITNNTATPVIANLDLLLSSHITVLFITVAAITIVGIVVTIIYTRYATRNVHYTAHQEDPKETGNSSEKNKLESLKVLCDSIIKNGHMSYFSGVRLIGFLQSCSECNVVCELKYLNVSIYQYSVSDSNFVSTIVCGRKIHTQGGSTHNSFLVEFATRYQGKVPSTHNVLYHAQFPIVVHHEAIPYKCTIGMNVHLPCDKKSEVLISMKLSSLLGASILSAIERDQLRNSTKKPIIRDIVALPSKEVLGESGLPEMQENPGDERIVDTKDE